MYVCYYFSFYVNWYSFHGSKLFILQAYLVARLFEFQNMFTYDMSLNVRGINGRDIIKAHAHGGIVYLFASYINKMSK